MENKSYKDILEERILQRELAGEFDKDVNDNPEYEPLKPGQVDYKKKKLSSKIKAFFCELAVKKFIKSKEKAKEVCLDKIIGAEKLKGLNSGAMITSNHFHPFDSYPIIKMLKQEKIKRKFRIVLAEHNYAGGTGFFGKVFRNKNTIPLASNKQVMIECYQAIQYFLKKGDLILIYPEQAMWNNYKKPRPLKEGAFRFAVKSNVPVIACFVTMEKGEGVDFIGLPVQKLTLHILDVIYPKQELSYKENIKYMKERNEQLMREKYEEVYGIKLEFLTKEV